MHSSIKSLKGAGHIEVVRRSFRGDQVAVWHGPTDGGIEEYEAWLNEPLEREPVRDDLYLKWVAGDQPQTEAGRRSWRGGRRGAANPDASGTVPVRLVATTTNLGWSPGTILLNGADYRRWWRTPDVSEAFRLFGPG